MIAIRPLTTLSFRLLLFFSCIVPSALAEDKPGGARPYRHRIVGLFQPDREQDLRDLFVKLPQFKLVSIDYPTAEVVLEYDPAQIWPGEKPDKFVERLDDQLRNVSRGAFGAKPLRAIPLEKLKRVEIPVEGLDCKGCSYAAYRLVFQLPGVEVATASFHSGKVTALFDPKLIDQAKLEEALKKGGVEIKPPKK